MTTIDWGATAPSRQHPKPPQHRTLLSKNMRLFISPEPAGRKITAGFSFIQRISKGANVDVWFPEAMRQILDKKIADGHKLVPQDFPAQWAAVRQFELLQEAGNYKVYDLKTDHLWRAMRDKEHSMRAGGYRVTIASIGSYAKPGDEDDLEILDKRLQERLSTLTHVLYLEDESERINGETGGKLARGEWDFRNELPHVGVTLGSRHLFRPVKEGAALTAADVRHKRAMTFFDIISQLPQRHIVHDTAIGLQLPDLNSENEQPYCALGEDTLLGFNQLMTDLFTPFDHISLGRLNGHEGAGNEIKATVQHMQAYGDRLNSGADRHYSGLAHYALQ